jgi:hypothetical protein
MPCSSPIVHGKKVPFRHTVPDHIAFALTFLAPVAVMKLEMKRKQKPDEVPPLLASAAIVTA